MVRMIVLGAATSLFLASPAFAGHCPKDAAAIDAYLERVDVDEAVEVEVIALKEKGMELHNAGNHGESEAALAEAMRKLLSAQ